MICRPGEASAPREGCAALLRGNERSPGSAVQKGQRPEGTRQRRAMAPPLQRKHRRTGLCKRVVGKITHVDLKQLTRQLPDESLDCLLSCPRALLGCMSADLWPSIHRRLNRFSAISRFSHPEGEWKLAGGASHRIRRKIERAPEGALEIARLPPPPPGRIPFSDGIRWLAPPANTSFQN